MIDAGRPVCRHLVQVGSNRIEREAHLCDCVLNARVVGHRTRDTE